MLVWGSDAVDACVCVRVYLRGWAAEKENQKNEGGWVMTVVVEVDWD